MVSKKGLIRFGGEVITVAHAVSCAAKGFRGCTKAETAAMGKVLARAYRAITK